MSNVNIKEVNGGEVSTPANSTDGILLDTSTTSVWISVANLAVYVWGYLTSLTAKTTPVDADTMGINDSAASNVGKKVTLANLAIYVWNYLTSLTAKTTLVDADQIPLADSAASNVGKKITWTNFMAQVAAFTATLTNKSIDLASNTLTATSLQLKTAVSDETGSGALVFGTAPTLSAPAIADFTSAQHDHGDADDGGTLVYGAISGIQAPVTIHTQSGGINIGDATTYYLGAGPPNHVFSTTESELPIEIPYTGTIYRTDLYIFVGGTLGTTETSTVSLRLNATSDTSVSTAVTMSAVYQVFSNSAMAMAVTAGDNLQVKLVSATFATNPTTVRWAIMIYLR